MKPPCFFFLFVDRWHSIQHLQLPCLFFIRDRCVQAVRSYATDTGDRFISSQYCCAMQWQAFCIQRAEHAQAREWKKKKCKSDTKKTKMKNKMHGRTRREAIIASRRGSTKCDHALWIWNQHFFICFWSSPFTFFPPNPRPTRSITFISRASGPKLSDTALRHYYGEVTLAVRNPGLGRRYYVTPCSLWYALKPHIYMGNPCTSRAAFARLGSSAGCHNATRGLFCIFRQQLKFCFPGSFAYVGTCQARILAVIRRLCSGHAVATA